MNDNVWLAGKLGTSALAKRFEAVADNLANVNTPLYKRKEVDFEDALREALGKPSEKGQLQLKRTDGDHLANQGKPAIPATFEPDMKTVSDNAYRLDGNNVDPEIEMAKLAETKMAYNGIMRMMGKRAEMLKTAMSGG
jgi:flagellar basal-body rod protein FlgB